MKPWTFSLLTVISSTAVAQSDAPSASLPGNLAAKITGTIAERTIEGLLIDSAEGNVSAASLARVKSDALNVVENVRDFSLLVNAFDGNAKGFGLSITPARTTFPFPRINLTDYAKPDAYFTRLLGAVTFGYAQGKEAISGGDYTRRAFSVGTSAFVATADDPLVVVASKDCGKAALDVLADAQLDAPAFTKSQLIEFVKFEALEAKAAKGDSDAIQQIAVIRQSAAGGNKISQKQVELVDGYALRRRAKEGDITAKAEVDKLDRAGIRVEGEQEKAALAAFNACAAAALKKHEEKWNRSRYSLSWAKGSIKASDGSGSGQTLGNTVAISVVYGFDGVSALQDRAALTFTVRRSRNEPVLKTLTSPAVKFTDSNLVAARLSTGSSSIRLLAEASNAKEGDITTSQNTMRRAIGIDYRVMSGLWLNLRYGKQRKASGSGDETGSFVILNYSPSAVLGH